MRLLLGSFSHDPGSRLAGILIAIVLAKPLSDL
jgi:hypothetical protein